MAGFDEHRRPVVGSALWTLLIGRFGATVTWLVIGVAVGIAQGPATFLLPDIRPGQELESIAT